MTAAVKEEVLAEVALELLPKSDGARELAIDQEDGQKAAESLRHHVVDGVVGPGPVMRRRRRKKRSPADGWTEYMRPIVLERLVRSFHLHSWRSQVK